MQAAYPCFQFAASFVMLQKVDKIASRKQMNQHCQQYRFNPTSLTMVCDGLPRLATILNRSTIALASLFIMATSNTLYSIESPSNAQTIDTKNRTSHNQFPINEAQDHHATLQDYPEYVERTPSYVRRLLPFWWLLSFIAIGAFVFGSKVNPWIRVLGALAIFFVGPVFCALSYLAICNAFADSSPVGSVPVFVIFIGIVLPASVIEFLCFPRRNRATIH